MHMKTKAMVAMTILLIGLDVYKVDISCSGMQGM